MTGNLAKQWHDGLQDCIGRGTPTSPSATGSQLGYPPTFLVKQSSIYLRAQLLG